MIERLKENLVYFVFFFLSLILIWCFITLRIRLATLVFLSLLLVAFAVRMKWGIYLLLVYYALVGLIRRLMYVYERHVRFDPLSVAHDFLVAFFFILILLTKKEKVLESLKKDRLFGVAVFLLLVEILQIFNPLQGNVFVGMGGAKFIIIPFLGFFIGYLLDGLEFEGLWKLMLVVGVATALYGWKQILFGYAPFEMKWWRSVRYFSLSIPGGGVRPISTFSSAADYADFLWVMVLISLYYLTEKRHFLLGGMLFVFFSLSLFFSAIRTTFFSFAVGFSLYLHFSIKNRVRRVLFDIIYVSLLILAVAFLYFGENLFYSMGKMGIRLIHMREGILYPFSPTSTFWGHYAAWKNAISHFLKNPLGYGLGAPTLAGIRMLGRQIWTESDVLSTIVATGILGLFGLFLFFFQSIKRTWCLWDKYYMKDGLLIMSIAIPMIFISQTLSYFCGLLVFLVLGIACRKYMEIKESEAGETEMGSHRLSRKENRGIDKPQKKI